MLTLVKIIEPIEPLQSVISFKNSKILDILIFLKNSKPFARKNDKNIVAFQFVRTMLQGTTGNRPT